LVRLWVWPLHPNPPESGGCLSVERAASVPWQPSLFWNHGLATAFVIWPLQHWRAVSRPWAVPFRCGQPLFWNNWPGYRVYGLAASSPRGSGCKRTTFSGCHSPLWQPSFLRPAIRSRSNEYNGIIIKTPRGRRFAAFLKQFCAALLFCGTDWAVVAFMVSHEQEAINV